MRKSYTIYIILILVLLQMSVSQTIQRSNSNIIEIGGLYGQLRHNTNEVPQIQSASTIYRDKLVLYPAVRFSHLFILNGIFSVNPFIGYSQFGGKSDNLSSGYEDEIWFDVIEWGSYFSYHINSYCVSVGGKYNYHIGKRRRDFIGFDSQRNPQWEVSKESLFFKDYSGDVGLKLWMDIYDDAFISTEGWFGVTSLLKSEWSSNGSAYQTNYRLMIGYRIY